MMVLLEHNYLRIKVGWCQLYTCSRSTCSIIISLNEINECIIKLMVIMPMHLCMHVNSRAIPSVIDCFTSLTTPILNSNIHSLERSYVDTWKCFQNVEHSILKWSISTNCIEFIEFQINWHWWSRPGYGIKSNFNSSNFWWFGYYYKSDIKINNILYDKMQPVADPGEFQWNPFM